MKLLLAIGLLLVLAVGVVVWQSATEEAAPMPEAEATDPVMETEVMEMEATTETNAATEVDGSMDPTMEAEVEITTSSEAPAAQTFTLDSFNYGYSMEEIRVPAGTEVTINLTNSGGFHDWVVDEFGAATEKISAGDTTSVTFTADAPGTYEYYCSVGNHRAQGMVGTLIVE